MFKSLLNIETAFRKIRFFSILFVCLCTGIVFFTIFKSFEFAEKQRQKIYVLDNGKSLMLALSQDLSTNRPVEAKEHIARFHELFFTLAPVKEAIESNIRRALYMSDKTPFNYYKDLAETGYYNRIISGNIQQIIQIDSIVCDFNAYPYDVNTYAKQMIIRKSNITERNLHTHCKLINSVKSDANPQGFTIENFEVIDNRDLRTIPRV